MEKILKYLKNGTLIPFLKEKIYYFFVNLFTHNEFITTKYIQNHNYCKLKKKYKKTIDEFETVLKKEKSNKVWFCWLQGYDNAPDLVKTCYNSLKKNMPDKDIVFLSEENIGNYISFPEYINKKYKQGKIGRAHYSDLLRISLLCEYGGTWIDSTVLCTSRDFASYVTSQPLFVFKEVELTRVGNQPIVASNWLISSEKNNEICLLTKKLLFEYWKKNNYSIDYFIFHFFFAMATNKYNEIWEKIPTFNNINPHILQFEMNNNYSRERWQQITNFSGFHKLNHHLKYNNKKTFYSEILEEYSEERKNSAI